jgi:saccharopepsin
MKLKNYIIFLIFIVHTFSLIEFDMKIKERNDNTATNQLIYLESNYTEHEITRLKDFIYSIPLCIGLPKQCFQSILDTGSFVTWVPDITYEKKHFDGKTKYNPYSSKLSKPTTETQTIVYGSGIVKGYVVEDVISFSTEQYNTTLKFLSITEAKFENPIEFDGLIGLGRDYNNKYGWSFSIIEYLYDNLAISNMMFSFKTLDQITGKFYIGGPHPDFNNVDFARCNIFRIGSGHRLWGCRLSYVLIGETTKMNFWTNAHAFYEQAIIDSGSSIILAPYSALNVFDKLFEKYLEIGLCMIGTTDERIYTIYCSMKVDIHKLPAIYLVLNGYGLKLQTKDLFHRNMSIGKYTFNIEFDSKRSDWIIGQTIFNNYHVLFNMDENYVGFAGSYDDFTEFTDDDDFVLSDYLIFVIIGALFITIIIGTTILLCLRRRKKIEREEERSRLLNTSSSSV